VTALVGAALLAAFAAVLLASGPGLRGRADPAGGSAHRAHRQRSQHGPSTERAPDAATRWAGPAAVLAGAAVWLVVGGGIGAAAGALIVVAVPLLVSRLEPARVRQERLELIRTAPLVADLLAAALAAGVPASHALPVVARAVGGPAERLLAVVQRRIELGEAPEQAWLPVVSRPGLGGIARAVARSARTGAPLASLLSSAAVDLRAEASAAALVQVRSASVRAVLPLGLCLLPSFGLLGIVPVVAGLLPAL
jgi:Flp pilus assembly protein TadB